jgi:hypothetical protein
MDEEEMWDWTTSILKAQVRRRKRLKAGLLVLLGFSHTPTPSATQADQCQQPTVSSA